MRLCILISVLVALWSGIASAEQTPIRHEEHQKYAEQLWEFIHRPDIVHTNWGGGEVHLPVGPTVSANDTLFLNSVARNHPKTLPARSVVVAQHYRAPTENGDTQLMAYTVWYRPADGYDNTRQDWYFAHYLPDGTIAKTSVDKSDYEKRGFVDVQDGDRLWVFPTASQALADFLAQGEPAKHVSRPEGGPDGKTIMALNANDIDRYLATKRGFELRYEEEATWVFRSASAALNSYDAGAESANPVVRPAEKSGQPALKAVDAETIDSYLFTKPGFFVQIVEGQLWVLRDPSAELVEFRANGGESAKSTTDTAAGPNGMTVRSSDSETIQSYLQLKTAARP